MLEQLARTFGEDPRPTPLQAAQRALSGKHILLVLDGAEEAEDLEQVLSVCANCAVLVTSRRRSDAADLAFLLDVRHLPPDEAVAVVQAWQMEHQTDEAVITRICQLVGGLPLALRLVGSYLALHPGEADEYLAWLEEDQLEALHLGQSRRKSVPVLLERSVARLRPDAQRVLSMIGLLALAPFERAVVAEVLELAGRAASRALGELVDYGLLVQVGTAYEVSHPLIHTYARKGLLAHPDEAPHRALVERLIVVLAAHFAKVGQMKQADGERLVPHIQFCALHLEQQKQDFLEAAALFHDVGGYLRERARYEHAEPLYRRALAIREHVLGSEHRDIASSLDRLAVLYQDQGKYGHAEPLFQRALAISEKALGPNHLNIAATLDNLAQLYQAQGRYTEAEPLFQRSLAISEKALPPDHPDIAITLENYASLLRKMKRPEEAHPFEQRAQAIQAREAPRKTHNEHQGPRASS